MPVSENSADKQINQLKSKIADLEAQNAKLQYDKRQLLSTANEIKYQTIFYNAPIGILHYNNNGVITDCNDFFVGIIGSSKEALIGLNMIKDLKDQKIIQAVKTSLSKGYAEYEDIYASVSADKKTYVRILFKGILGIDGEIFEGLGIIEDITNQKKSEKAIKEQKEKYYKLYSQYLEQNRELKKYVHQLEKANKDLKKARDKAEESDRLKK